jgi:uncharacterized protein (DUF1499 family)
MLAVGGLVLVALAGAMIWVRLAPVDAREWHKPVRTSTIDVVGPCARSVSAMDGGAFGFCSPTLTPVELLTRLDGIAMATPRTRRIAGSPEDGLITWETRSALWGFPDYTTAQAGSRGNVSRLDIEARQRFGRGDMGVNAARLLDWLSKLDAS